MDARARWRTVVFVGIFTLVSLVVVVLLDGPRRSDYSEMVLMVGTLTGLMVGAVALYAWRVRTRPASTIVGYLIVVPTILYFAGMIVSMVLDDSDGQAAGMVFAFGLLYLIAWNYLVAMVGTVADFFLRRRAS